MTHIASLSTHTAPQLDPVSTFASSAPVAQAAAAPSTSNAGAGAIKCICGFQDDDGSKYVYCENCDTWQHVECYYPETAWSEEETHNCVDCEPRVLDAKRATERQKRRREELDGGDRKKPRPPAKSHKKKPKEPTTAGAVAVAPVNGWSANDRPDAGHGHGSDRQHSGSREMPPAKRPKTSHRASSSISSQVDKSTSLTPLSESHRRSKSQPKGAHHSTTPPSAGADHAVVNGYHDHDRYSIEFMRLHREDFGDSPLKANLMSNINFTSTFSSWIQDPEALAEATHGKRPSDVFQGVAGSFDALAMPEITKRHKDDPSTTCFGQHPIWQYLTVESPVFAGGLVGELKGEVGHVQDYWRHPNNRASLRHPEPFVFFHPYLPIYIDTRKEGTRCRYIRRSCRPNVNMRTLISDGNECHFCFCATENLDPGTEITIGWDPEPEMLDLLNRELNDGERTGVKTEPLTRAEYEHVSSWIKTILANFGGCACEDPQRCSLTQPDRRRGGTPLDPLKVTKAKKSKKGRQQASPLSTGQATNSRAGSEGTAVRDREDGHDESPTSGSGRSRPRSRDITPSTHPSGEPLPSSTLPPMSDREKRKIAALEKTFEQIEHDSRHPKNQGPKKQKRNGSGSHPSHTAANATVRVVPKQGRAKNETDRSRPQKHTASTAQHPATPEIGRRADNANASTSRKSSASPTVGQGPFSNAMPSPSAASGRRYSSQPPGRSMLRPNYVDSSMQTDQETEAQPRSPAVRTPKKSIVPLTKKLLQRCYQHRVRQEETQNRMDVDTTGTDNRQTTNSPGLPIDRLSVADPTISADTIMTDVDAATSAAPVPSTDAAIQPIDANVQKPGPVEHATSAPPPAPTDPSSLPIKPPPPPSTQRPSNHPTRETPRTNGHHPSRPADLRVQLPSVPSFSTTSVTSPSTPSTTAGTPTSLPGTSAQSPHIHTAFSPAVINSIAQPSPVKKKLSLSDYSRRKKAETPSATSNLDKQLGLGTTASPTVLKTAASFPEETKAALGVENAPVKDEPAPAPAPPGGGA